MLIPNPVDNKKLSIPHDDTLKIVVIFFVSS